MATIERITPIEAVHPTEPIIDEISERGLSRKDMATRLDMQPSKFSRMIKKKETILKKYVLQLRISLQFFQHCDCVHTTRGDSFSFAKDQITVLYNKLDTYSSIITTFHKL